MALSQGLPGSVEDGDLKVDLDSTQGWTATILSFDPELGTWAEEPITLREARSDHALVPHGGRLLVLGGYDGVERLGSAESFGPGDSQTRLEERLYLPLPGRNFAAAVLRCSD